MRGEGREARGEAKGLTLRFEWLGRSGPAELVVKLVPGVTYDDLAPAIYREVKRSGRLASDPEVEVRVDDDGQIAGAVYAGPYSFPFTTDTRYPMPDTPGGVR